jgi:DNA-binding PadR family transcriptional regulator
MSAARLPLPPLTHLQFLILGALLAGEQSGKALRRELAQYGIRRTAAAFYQMMARIEDANWVSGSYTQQIVDGQIIKERSYRVTATGERAWRRTRDFYAEAGRAGRVAHA